MYLFALSRKNRDFNERDRLLLALLRPHLMSALRNVTELESIVLERDLLQRESAERRGGILLRDDGKIRCISSMAAEIAEKFFARSLTQGDLLPESVSRWVEAETETASLMLRGSKKEKMTAAARSPKRVDREAFIVEKDGKTLTIKLLHDVATGEIILFLAETDHLRLVRDLKQYDLTHRESEVVLGCRKERPTWRSRRSWGWANGRSRSIWSSEAAEDPSSACTLPAYAALVAEFARRLGPCSHPALGAAGNIQHPAAGVHHLQAA